MTDTIFKNIPYGNVTVTQEVNNFESRTQNLKIQRINNGAQRWLVNVNFQGTQSDRMWNEFMSHATANAHTPFEIVMPQHWLDNDYITTINDITVAADANGGSNIVSINSSSQFILPIGRYIKFGNHTKIYQIANSINSTDGSVTDLQIYPQLVTPVPNGTVVNYEDINITVLHDLRNTSITIRNGYIQRASWRFLEYL